LIIQKDYVGFYYMPIYSETKLEAVFKPEFLKTLHGKSCFYIMMLDDELLSQIKKALKTGFDLYKKRGWI